MMRDFSEESKQRLLGLVKDVEEEKWCDATDWLGDRWLDFEGWIGTLDVQDYITKVNKYHKKVIDKNNTTADDIETIFTNVNNINTQYVSCFGALLTQLKSYTEQIVNLGIVIDPANGVFNSEFIGGGLKHSLEEYLEKKAVMDAINSNEGLTEEKLQELQLDNESCQDILEKYGNIILENTPNISLGEQIEIPIGPGMVFYYKVSGKIDGEGDFDLNYIIEDQKLKLKKYGYETDPILGVSAEADSEGNFVINSSGEHNSSSVNFENGTMSYKYSDEIGNSKYSLTYEYNPATGELKVEQSVTTDVDGGSVTSTIGIKKSSESNWQPMPEPAPITSPYTGVIPDFEIDWDAVGSIVVIAGVTYVVVKTVAGVALAPATGGLSLGLVVV